MIRPDLAQASFVMYHSTKFGAHSPTRSFFSSPSVLNPAANLSASTKASAKVRDLFWCLEMTAFRSPNFHAVSFKSVPTVI
jgi:hypothetical protein